jgi:hypothetical protein
LQDILGKFFCGRKIKHLVGQADSNRVESGSRNVQSGQQVTLSFAEGIFLHGNEASFARYSGRVKKYHPALAG